jgi:hypothetical protein
MKTQFTEQSERKLLSEFDPALSCYEEMLRGKKVLDLIRAVSYVILFRNLRAH